MTIVGTQQLKMDTMSHEVKMLGQIAALDIAMTPSMKCAFSFCSV